MAKRTPTTQDMLREQLAAAVAETHRLNADADPDEVERYVTAIGEQVRQKLYEESRRNRRDTSNS